MVNPVAELGLQSGQVNYELLITTAVYVLHLRDKICKELERLNAWTSAPKVERFSLNPKP